MVRTKAPLLSLSASGSVGHVLIASNWKGRSYMKKLTIPTNPKSGAQLGVRAMMQYLTRHWSDLSAGDKATWEEPAEAQTISPMDAFISDNLIRHSTGLYAGNAFPIAATGGAPTGGVGAITNYGRGLKVPIQIPPFQSAGSWTIYRSTSTGFTPHYTNAINIQWNPTAASYDYIDTPLAAGTYYYRSFSAGAQGFRGPVTGQFSGTVT